MKRAIFILLIIALFISLIQIYAKPVILFSAKQQLKNVFKQSQVSIGSLSLSPLKGLIFSEVEIKRDNIYDFTINEVKISYTPFSLVKRIINKSYLKDINVTINLAKKNYSEFAQYLNLKPGAFLIKDLGVANLNLNLKSKDSSIQANISLELSPQEQLIYNLETTVNSFNAKGLILENAHLKASQGESGDFYVGNLQYDKAKISQIKGKAMLIDKNLFLDILDSLVLGGQVLGDFSIGLDKFGDYRVNLEFIDLDLEKFVKDFNLGEKLQMSGKLNGRITSSGSGFKVNALSGDFITAEPGGVMIIKDAEFLKNLARSSRQSPDILVESFKDYHYNTGIMKLSKKKDNIVLDIDLEGESGKRNLSTTLYTLY